MPNLIISPTSALLSVGFGPAKSWTFGNSQTITRTFDLDGRMTGNAVESAVTYDAASRITGLTGIFPGRTYGYDSLDRLTSFTDPTGNGSYAYDATGNRTQSIVGTVTNNYSINATSNRINSITVGASTLTYVHDANGSITNDGTYSFTYDPVGRLTQANQGATLKGTYTLNGLGQRVMKVAGSTTRLFAYDEAGHLIGEYTGTGGLVQETVWLGDTPIATIRGSTTYYVHADHLNAPRKVTDQAQATRWQWDYASFGSGAANQNPGGLGTFSYNLRFPGQYFDSETGLHYNTFRDYDPKTGRYIESDPLGLAAGVNTYLYATANPLSSVDFYGLASCSYSIASHTLSCVPNAGGKSVTLGPNGVFSGVGKCRNNDACSNLHDLGPIPPGTYNMNPDDRAGHEGFWRLEPNPHVPAWRCYLGLNRCGFELHPGGISLGCITADKNDPAVMDQYNQINGLLNQEVGDNHLRVVP